MNRTELRHRMLTAVSKGSVCLHHQMWDWADSDKRMWARDASSLTSMGNVGLLVRADGDFSPWRSVRLSDAGVRLLAEWDEKYGPVTP